MCQPNSDSLNATLPADGEYRMFLPGYTYVANFRMHFADVMLRYDALLSCVLLSCCSGCFEGLPEGSE